VLARVFAEPRSPAAVRRRAGRVAGPLLLRWSPVALVAVLLGLGWVACARWVDDAPWMTPRHRAEALCFALAEPPPFDPPMTIEPAAALLRERFPASMPPAAAIQQAMRFSDEMVVQRESRTVGDFEVAILWLRLPESGGSEHWLVVGWLEGNDLEVCSFRFGDPGPTLTESERVWGYRLLGRILKPKYFRAEVVPDVRMRAKHGVTMPRFGPVG
jgi:hypothetical protein